MKAWKVTWTDGSGRTQIRYRNSKHAALVRQTRINREGCKSQITCIEIPTAKFELVDFLNAQMNEVSDEWENQ